MARIVICVKAAGTYWPTWANDWRNVRLVKISGRAAIAASTVTGNRSVAKFGTSCAIPARECYGFIR